MTWGLASSALLAATLALGCNSGPSTPSDPPPRSDATQPPQGSNVEPWVRQLCSDDPGIWREAQVRAAMSDDAAAVFDRALEVCPDHATARATTGVAVSFAFETTWAAVSSRPRLAALVEARLQTLRARASRPGHLDTMMVEAGLPVVIGEELLDSKDPQQRGLGVVTIARATMWVPARYTSRIAGDGGTYVENHQDHTSDVAVSQLVTRWASAHSQATPALRVEWAITLLAGFEAGRYDGHFTLQNALRFAASNFDAPDEETWWSRTRPAWRAWWRLAGTDGAASDPARFQRAVQRSRGIGIETVPGTATITLSGPAGATGTLSVARHDGQTVDTPMKVTGALPLRVELGATQPQRVDLAISVAIGPRQVEWTQTRAVQPTDDLMLEVIDPPELLEAAGL